MSLARLWRDQGKVAASAQTAGSGVFTEGFDTRDLKEARRLLKTVTDEERRNYLGRLIVEEQQKKRTPLHIGQRL
jgi:hypothetical protein